MQRKEKQRSRKLFEPVCVVCVVNVCGVCGVCVVWCVWWCVCVCVCGVCVCVCVCVWCVCGVCVCGVCVVCVCVVCVWYVCGVCVMCVWCVCVCVVCVWCVCVWCVWCVCVCCVLCVAVLSCCSVLYCAVLCCIVLYWAGLGWAGLCFALLCFALLCFALLCFASVGLGWVGLGWVGLGLSWHVMSRLGWVWLGFRYRIGSPHVMSCHCMAFRARASWFPMTCHLVCCRALTCPTSSFVQFPVEMVVSVRCVPSDLALRRGQPTADICFLLSPLVLELLDNRVRCLTYVIRHFLVRLRFVERIFATPMTESLPQSLSTASGDQRLRGVHLDSVLRRRGAILRASTGDDHTYRLSAPVVRLDAFLSHTWSTPYWMKWMTLSLEYNFGVALMWSLFVCALVCGLSAGKCLPLVDMESVPTHTRHPRGPYCTLLCFVVFYAVLHFGADVTSSVTPRWRRSPMVFLDKVCIHQTDTQIKAEGISNLDNFVVKSDTFVILRADDYLERLWTVFEFGSVLLLHDLPNIVTLPVTIAPALFALSTVFTFNQLIGFALRTDLVAATQFHATVRQQATVLVHITTGLLLNLFLRRLHRESARSVRQLSAFSISSAKCSVEEDRAVVQKKIASMMQATGITEDSDVLSSFDAFVRTVFPPAMDRGYRIPMKSSCTVFLTFLGNGFDVLGADLAAGTTLRFAVPRFLFWVFWTVPAGTLLFFGTSVLTSRRLHLRGWTEFAYVVLVTCLQTLFVGVFQLLNRRISDAAATSDSVAACYFALMLMLIAVNCFLYRSEVHCSLWTCARKQLALKPMSVPPAPASNVEEEPNAMQVTVEGPCGADDSDEVTRSAEQRSDERPQAHALPLEETERAGALNELTASMAQPPVAPELHPVRRIIRMSL